MPQSVIQTLMSSNDSTIEVVSAVVASVAKTHLVYTHADLDLSLKPSFNVNGVDITFGELGSNAEYEIKRISRTQSIILCTNNVTPAALPIGDAVIGESFIIQ
jgi:hypothetical protein